VGVKGKTIVKIYNDIGILQFQDDFIAPKEGILLNGLMLGKGTYVVSILNNGKLNNLKLIVN